MGHLKLVASNRAPDSTLYAEVLEQLDTGMCVFDADGLVQTSNRAFRKLLGLPEDWVRVKKGAKGVVPATEELITGWVARVLAHGDFTETVALTDRVTLRVTGKSLPSGGVSLAVSEGDDARRNSTADTEARFRALLAHTPSTISLKDVDGRFVVVNEAWERELQVPAEDMLGKTIWDALPGQDWSKSDAADARLLAGEADVIEDLISVDVAGRGTRFYQRTKFPVLDSGGRPMGVGTANYDVTDLVHARDELRRSETNLRHAERLARIGHWIHDLVTGTLEWSDSFYEILGFDKDKGPDLETFLGCIHPDDRHIIDEAIQALSDGESVRDIRFRVVLPTGETHYLREVMEAEYDEAGTLVRMFGITQEVTDAELAAQALRESDARLRAIIDHSNSMILLKDREGRFQYVGRVFEEAYSVPADQVIGKTTKEVTPRNFAEDIEAMDLQVMETGETIQKELAVTFADGSEHVLLASKFPVRDDAGNIVGTGGINMDITEQIADRRALAESEARNRFLLENSPAAVTLKDAEGRFQIANDRVAEFLGLSPDEMIGKTVWELLPDKDWREVDEADALVLSGERARVDDEVLIDVPGVGPRYLSRTKYPVLDDDGRPIGVGTITTDITGRIEAEEALRRSEAGLRYAQKLARIGNWERNFVTGENYWSDEVFEILGIEQSEVPDFEKMLDLIHPDDRQKLRDKLASIFAGVASYDVEFRVVLPSGEVRHVHELSEAEFDAEGKAIRCVGVLQDVTAARQSEQALRESEAKFHALFEEAGVGISLVDANGTFFDVNGKLAEMLGYEREELAGQSLRSITAPADLERSSRTLRDLIAGSYGLNRLEKQYLRKDGTALTASVVSSVVTDENGDFKFTVAIIEDITERKKAEAALRESEERFRSLVDNLPNALSLKDRDHRIILANKEFEHMFGVSGDDYVGKTIPAALTPPDEWAEVKAADEALFDGENPGYEKQVRLRIDGKPEKILDLKKFTVTDGDGNITGVATISTDITARVRAEEALRRSEQGFRNAQRIASMGHWARDLVSDEVYYSEEVARVMNISPGDNFTLEEFYAKIHPDDVAALKEKMADLLAGRGDFEMTFRIFDEHGVVRYIRDVLETEYDENGRAVRISGVLQDITERRKAEQQLRESEELLRMLTDNIPSALTIKDEDGRFVFANPAVEQVFRLPPEKFIGQTAHPVSPDADWPSILLPDKEILTGARELSDQEVRFTLADGTKRIIQIIKFPVRDDAGRPTKVGTICTDITERVEAEQQLRESEQRFRALVDNIPGAVTLKGPDKNVLFLNGTAEEWFGVTEEQIIGKRIANVTKYSQRNAETHEKFIRAQQQAIDTGEPVESEFPIIFGDGKERVIQVIYFPVESDDGGAANIGNLIFDVTNRVEVERALRESEERFRTLIDNLPNAVSMRDREHRYVLINRAFTDLYARDPSEVLGYRSDEVFPTRGWSDIETVDDKLFSGEIDLFEDELELQIRDGETRFYEMSKFPVFGPGGEVVNIGTVSTDITDRKTALDALRKSEARLANAQRIAHLGSWDWNITDNTLYWSEEIYRIFGLEPNEFAATYDAFLAAVHPDDRAMVDEAARAAVNQKVPYHIDHRIVLPTGEIRIVHEQGEVVRDKDDRPLRMSGTVQDVTELRLAEQQLRESEERFRALVDNLPAAVTLKDENDELLLVNNQLAEWYGVPAEKFVGRQFTDVVKSDHQHLFDRNQELVRERREPIFTEIQVETAGGKVRDMSTTFFPVGSGPGDAISVGVVSFDITELRQAERALRESEQWFRGVIDNAPSSVTLKDADGKFVYVNRIFREWYDVELDEVVGRDHDEVFREGRGDGLVAIEREVLETGEPVQREMPMLFADGKEHTLLGNKFLVSDDDGVPIGSGFFGFDITEYKRTEEQLRQAQKMEVVGQLTGGVAHDFNNLLAVIVGNLEMAGDLLQPGTPVNKFIESAFVAAERGATLAHHLLAFSRQQVLQPENIDLAGLIHETKDLMAISMGEKISVEIDVGDGLWPCKVDRVQLQNAILNLSINARDAMPDGGRVIIGVHNAPLDGGNAEALDLAPGDYVCLSVGDNGPGIPDDVLEHVYEPFFTTKDVGQGSGLGLSMVYGFAQQSGGAAEIETEVGEGTTVKLYFPAAAVAEPGAARTNAVDADIETAVDPANPDATILLVEDNESFRDITRMMLQSLNFRVIEFATADDALDAVAGTEKFDLLLSDIGLPGEMDGHDLAAYAASARPGLKIVLMSAHTDRQPAGGIVDSNVAAFLRKPYRKVELAKTLRRVLGLDS